MTRRTFLGTARRNAGLAGSLKPREVHHMARAEVHRSGSDPWIAAVRTRAAERGLSFGDAASQLATQRPDAYRAYRDRIEQGVA